MVHHRGLLDSTHKLLHSHSADTFLARINSKKDTKAAAALWSSHTSLGGGGGEEEEGGEGVATKRPKLTDEGG